MQRLYSLRPNERTIDYLVEQLPLLNGDSRQLLERLIDQLRQRAPIELPFADAGLLVGIIDALDDEERDPYEIIFELKMELLYGQPLTPPGFDPASRLNDAERYLVDAEIPLAEEEIEEGGIHDVELAGGKRVIVKFYNAYDHDQEAGLFRAQLTPARAATAELLSFAFADAMGEPYRSIATPVVVREIHGRDALVLARRSGWHVPAIAPDVSERLAEQLRAAALLDAVIGEPDRHSRNWVLDEETQAVGAFDHGHALHDYHDTTGPGDFISWRLRHQPELDESEITLLEQLEHSYLVDQVRFYLGAGAAARLERRLRRMIETGRLDDGTNQL